MFSQLTPQAFQPFEEKVPEIKPPQKKELEAAQSEAKEPEKKQEQENVSLTKILAKFRMCIIRDFGQIHIERKNKASKNSISKENEMHVHNLFEAHALKRGWVPNSKANLQKVTSADLAKIESRDYQEFENYFKARYTPESIADYVRDEVTREYQSLLAAGCDVFLMVLAKNGKNCKASNKNCLYLYYDRDKTIGYFHEYTGRVKQVLKLDDPEVEKLLNKASFNQPAKNFTKCTNAKINEAVLNVTSQKGHTLKEQKITVDKDGWFAISDTLHPESAKRYAVLQAHYDIFIQKMGFDQAIDGHAFEEDTLPDTGERRIRFSPELFNPKFLQ